MRLGGPVFETYGDPDEWAAAVRRSGYGAAYCPLGIDADDAAASACAAAAAAADVVIAEVGAWSNPISPDDEVRRQAIQRCCGALALADRVGACCCVNISGSRADQWDGPDAENLTAATFDLIVETVRRIIDAVRPTRTFYTLETMPWAYPDSPDSYVRLIEAIDRERFGVHLDPVNLVCSPQRYYANGELIRECFAKLAPHVKSCHAKDILLSPKLTTHLDEVRPGLGGLDYAAYLGELDKLHPDVPLMMEHMARDDYPSAAEHIRALAAEVGAAIR